MTDQRPNPGPPIFGADLGALNALGLGGDDEALTEHVPLRLGKTLKALALITAGRSGFEANGRGPGLGRYIRWLIRKDVRRHMPADHVAPPVFMTEEERRIAQQLVGQCQSIGGLLNQLVRNANLIAAGYSAEPPSADEIEKTMTEIKAVGARISEWTKASSTRSRRANREA